MKVLLSRPRGFCAGVEMALECVEKALDLFGGPLDVYHQIVHNRSVVESFEKRGVIFVNELEEIPPNSTVVYRAHGVSPKLRLQSQARNLRVIDATCPLVLKVHNEARNFAREGYTIFLIGHRGHDEVAGVVGEAPQQTVVIESQQDLNMLQTGALPRVAYLTQTTLGVEDTQRTVSALQSHFSNIRGRAKEDDLSMANC